MSQLRLHVVVSNLFSENAYLAHLEGRDDCIVVEPGFATEEIVEYLTRQRRKPAVS